MSVSFRGVPLLPLLLPLLLPILPSCAGTAPQREGVTPTQAHMYAHYDRAGEVHDALVRGDLARAREGATWMATHQDPMSLPAGADQHSALLSRYATQTGQAQDLHGAAVSAAQMGRVCGDCHRQFQVKPRFLVGTAAPHGGSPKEEMGLHVWAAERMWEGLVGPEDYAWTSGAAALKEGWLDPGQVVSNPRDREAIRAMVQSIYDIGSRAEGAVSSEERAHLYGEFLTTCIDCHRVTGAIIR